MQYICVPRERAAKPPRIQRAAYKMRLPAKTGQQIPSLMLTGQHDDHRSKHSRRLLSALVRLGHGARLIDEQLVHLRIDVRRAIRNTQGLAHVLRDLPLYSGPIWVCQTKPMSVDLPVPADARVDNGLLAFAEWGLVARKQETADFALGQRHARHTQTRHFQPRIDVFIARAPRRSPCSRQSPDMFPARFSAHHRQRSNLRRQPHWEPLRTLVHLRHSHYYLTYRRPFLRRRWPPKLRWIDLAGQ